MAQEGSKLLMGLVDTGKKGFAEFMSYQLREEMFKGSEAELYVFVQDHALAYGKLPSRKETQKWCNKNQTTVPSKGSLEEPPKFYFDKMEHRNLKLGLLKAMKAAEEHRQDDPTKSLETLTTAVVDMANDARREKLVNVSEDAVKMIHMETVKVEKGLDTGLKFGWPTFDAMSGGLAGGDLVSIVGRPGMGKTYMELHGMINAWHVGLTTLFVSMEMKNLPLVQRVAAMSSHTSISELKAAQVSSKQYRTMIKVLGSMQGEHGMWIADGSLSASVKDLYILCSQLKPDVLFIDGAYLLRRNDDMPMPRHEKINRNTEDVKFLAEQINIPIVQSFQFNRAMTKKAHIEEVDLEDIAGSDAIGQLSSVVLGLFEEDSIETALKRKIRILKGRNGERGEFDINWRFGGFGAAQKGEVKATYVDGKLVKAGTFNPADIMNFTEILPEKVNKKMKFY